MITTIAPQEGRANSGFIETIGISTAVGTVLGASTLPFYSQPTDHMVNLAIGAGIGLVTGLGIWFFGRSGSSSAEKFSVSQELRKVSQQRASHSIPMAKFESFSTTSHVQHLPYPKAPDKGLFGKPVWFRLVEVSL